MSRYGHFPSNFYEKNALTYRYTQQESTIDQFLNERIMHSDPRVYFFYPLYQVTESCSKFSVIQKTSQKNSFIPIFKYNTSTVVSHLACFTGLRRIPVIIISMTGKKRWKLSSVVIYNKTIILYHKRVDINNAWGKTIYLAANMKSG